ncbi:MAG: ferritin-like domain-containing protein [Myxococcota bacterium]
MTVFRPVVTLSWRLRGRRARRLFAFARAERGSMLDLRLAAQLTPSVARAARYLRHADDEQRHERMFARRGTELLREMTGDAALAPPMIRADAAELFERLGEVGFLAFVHRGERRGRRQFEVHRDHFRDAGDRKTAALFETILVDERRHEHYARQLLVELAGSEAAAKKALRRVARYEWWDRFRRLGRPPAQAFYWASMLVLYLVSFPLTLWVWALRPVRRGLHARDPGR